MMTAINLVNDYWQRMASNDFASLAPLLADGFVAEWPQTGERFDAAGFIRMNGQYPAHGPWRFTVHRIVGGDGEAVSDVGITDGVQQARAISFFTVIDGRIRRLVEFYPEPYPAPANRAHLVLPEAST
jgi:ketosteroid isomerase-like protein